MKTIAQSSIMGYEVVADEIVGDERVIETLVPLSEI
jgi:hypothetical protein